MSAIIIDGKKVSMEIENDVKSIIHNLSLCPKLAIFTDGKDPASAVYVRNKVRAADRCGICADVIPVDSEWNDFDISMKIKTEGIKYDGIILQLPISGHHDIPKIIESIPVKKDVDGLTLGSIGALHQNNKIPGQNGFFPCTPSGIMKLLVSYDIPIEGKHAVVVGRSSLVGKPVAELLLKKNATVTICHSKTENLSSYTKQADILVSAIGKPKFITGDMIKTGAAVIDVGINRVNGKLCGDVDFEEAKEVAGWITPVPGGVGPMTVSCLMENTMDAVLRNR